MVTDFGIMLHETQFRHYMNKMAISDNFNLTIYFHKTIFLVRKKF